MLADFLSILPLINTFICLGLAGFVLSRNPKSQVNRNFAMGMGALALMELGQSIAIHATSEDSYLIWVKVSFMGQVLMAGPWFVFSLTFGRSYPTKHLARWRYGIIGTYLLSFFFLTSLGLDWFVTDELTYKAAGFSFNIFMLLVLTAILANFENTFRSADHVQRWRMKFMLLGLGSIFGFMIYTLSQTLLFSSVAQDFWPLHSSVILVGCGLIAFSLVRHRLLEVDVFVSRYVIYNSATVLAAGVYLLLVGLTAQAIKTLGGDFNFYLASLFVFLAILFFIVMLLSYNVRKRVKVFIDRHFYKNKYDYRKEWLELTARLSTKLEVKELIPALTNMIFETFWIKQTLLWLYDDQDRELKFVQAPNDVQHDSIHLDPAVLDAIRDLDYPIVLDDPEEGKNHPQTLGISEDQVSRFKSMGISILVPLVVEKRLVGLLGLSKSHSGTPLNYEDYDLMRTMAKQAASSFLNARLSQKLLRSKEMETFHSFSTFLIHDLKNFVSMLSLVVENMNRNFDDPEFRKDALASISRTVEKMKRLMDRLTAFSRRGELRCSPTDLNELIRQALGEMGGFLKSRIIEDFQSLPTIDVDPVQIKKVVTNLLLNAEEAIHGDGVIRLATRVENGMVVFSVSDNGCGMSQEFIHNSLFRPFSTTKSHGFGIGLYQSKGIVEVHGGRMQVVSELGKGSTFRVMLPLEAGDRA